MNNEMITKQKKQKQNNIDNIFKEYESLLNILGDSFRGNRRVQKKLKIKQSNNLIKYFIDNYNINEYSIFITNSFGGNKKSVMKVINSSGFLLTAYECIKDNVIEIEEFKTAYSKHDIEF